MSNENNIPRVVWGKDPCTGCVPEQFPDKHFLEYVRHYAEASDRRCFAVSICRTYIENTWGFCPRLWNIYIHQGLSQSSPDHLQHTNFWIVMRLTLVSLLVALSLTVVGHGAVVDRNAEPLDSLVKRGCPGNKKGSGTRCGGDGECCSGHCLKQQQSSPWPTCAVSHY